MAKPIKKTTIYLEPWIFEHLRAKASDDSRSISDIVHKALSVLFGEYAEDIADFDAGIGESNVGLDVFAHGLKADGII